MLNRSPRPYWVARAQSSCLLLSAVLASGWPCPLAFVKHWVQAPILAWSSSNPVPGNIQILGERATKLPAEPNTWHSVFSNSGPKCGCLCFHQEEAQSPCGPIFYPSCSWECFWLQLSFLYPSPNDKWIHDDKRREKKMLFLLGQNHRRFLEMCICVSLTHFPILPFFSFFFKYYVLYF